MGGCGKRIKANLDYITGEKRKKIGRKEKKRERKGGRRKMWEEEITKERNKKE